jgi:hypothetical protein
MAVTKNITYTCSDGKVFANKAAAEEHEQALADAFLYRHENLSVESVKWLRTSYGGQRLLKAYSLDETGFWHIKGEDPNCDFGGHHHQPDLGVVCGTLAEAVNHAVRLDRFYTWGSGGDIIKLSVTQV